jgi:hypothetical protein
MGMKKHSSSGYKNGAGKSPKLRLKMKMDAEKNERKSRKTTCTSSSVSDLFKK